MSTVHTEPYEAVVSISRFDGAIFGFSLLFLCVATRNWAASASMTNDEALLLNQTMKGLSLFSQES